MFQGRWFLLVRRAYAADSDSDTSGSSIKSGRAALLGPAAPTGPLFVPVPIHMPNLGVVPAPAPAPVPRNGPLSIPYLAHSFNLLGEGQLYNIFSQPAPAVVQQAVAERMNMYYSMRQFTRRWGEFEENLNPLHNPARPLAQTMSREDYRDFWLAQDENVYATFMDDLHGHITVAFTLAYHLQQAEDNLTRMRGEEDRFLRRIRALERQLGTRRVEAESEAVVVKRLGKTIELLVDRLRMCEGLLNQKGGAMPPNIEFNVLQSMIEEMKRSATEGAVDSGESAPKISRLDDEPSTSGVNPLNPDVQANTSGENAAKSPRSEGEKKQ